MDGLGIYREVSRIVCRQQRVDVHMPASHCSGPTDTDGRRQVRVPIPSFKLVASIQRSAGSPSRIDLFNQEAEAPRQIPLGHTVRDLGNLWSVRWCELPRLV